MNRLLEIVRSEKVSYPLMSGLGDWNVQSIIRPDARGTIDERRAERP